MKLRSMAKSSSYQAQHFGVPESSLKRRDEILCRAEAPGDQANHLRSAERLGQSSGLGMMLPNVIIAGAPKCGTSSLFRWLTDHPQVGGSTMKETYFFIDPESHMYDPARH